MQLVAGNRQELQLDFAQVDRNFPCHLHRVGVKRHAFIARDLRDLFDGENHARLVVGPHHGNQRGIGANGIGQGAQTQAARFIDTDDCDFVTASLQFLRRFAHCAVFDRGGNDVLAIRSCFKRGMESGVVRFRAATGEHDLAWLATQECCHLLARLLDGFAYLRGEPVTARRIGEIFFQKRPHRFQHRRIDRCRRVIIEINNFLRRDHRGQMLSL